MTAVPLPPTSRLPCQVTPSSVPVPKVKVPPLSIDGGVGQGAVVGGVGEGAVRGEGDGLAVGVEDAVDGDGAAVQFGWW